MKKTSFMKRMLAIFVSFVMIATSIPFTAITASAASDPNLIAHFFDNSQAAKDVSKNYAGGANLPAVSEDAMVWNYTENAAEFKGSKTEPVKIKLSDLLGDKTATNANGFTIQFDAKTSMTGWGNFFEISNQATPYNGTGGTGKTYVYLSASSNNGEGYKCHSKVALTNGNESSSACQVSVNDNQWHNFRLVIGQGKLYIFVDGKLQSPGLDDSSKINDTLFNTFTNDGYLYLGASSYSQSPAFTGYMRNFMFVNNAKLDIAMASYESKMNGTVYTNMKPAYEAYVTAKKCAEALRYGDFESYPNIEGYADNLIAKTNDMQPWTAYTGNYANNLNSSKKVFGDWDNNSNADYKEIYKNILYIPTNGENAHYAYEGTGKQASDYKMTVRAYFDETILLYDGITTPQFGIALYMDGTSKPWNWGYGGMSLYYAGLTNYSASDATNTTGLQVGGKWRGRDGRLNHSWIYRTKGDSSVGATFVNNSTYYTVGDDSYLANIINYNKPSNVTDTWIEITPGFRFGIGADNKKYNEHYGNTDRTIRILNYKKIVDEINTKKSILSTVSEYTQGGLSNVINGFDLATKDPNSYFTSSNNYQSCKTNFEAAVSDLNQNATKDAFFTITAKKDNASGDILATFSLSNGCKANTVKCALNTVTPGNGQADTYHYDYVWTSNTITDVKANATYIATQSTEDHKFIDDGVNTPATCENTGIMNTKCSVCDYASTSVIKATGHNYSDFVKTWDKYVDDSTVYQHKKTCSNANCETPTVTANCSFSEWVTNADETEDSRTCSVCHGVQTREHKADQVTINFKRDGDVIVQSFTVDKGETVDAPASFILYDVDGHHIYSYPQASYEVTANIDIPATREDVAHTDVQTRKINLTNVDANGVATSCKEGLTYSYDLQTYCADCNTIISTVNTPVSALLHTETKQNNGSRDNHNIYCSVCNTVLRTEGHSLSTTDVSSTCIAQGYTENTCECGLEFKENFKELAPHTFGEYSNLGNNTHTRTCEVCQYEEIETCSFSVTKHDATCTNDGYLTNECTKCHVGSVFPDVYDASTYCSTAYPDGHGSTDSRKTEYRYTGIEEIEKLEVTYTYRLYSYLGWHGWVSAYDEAGNQIDTTGEASKDKQSGTRTFTVNGRYFSMNSDNLHNSDYYYYVTDIKVYPKVDKATGHNYVKNNDFGDGLLGTHSCSRCSETHEHNLDLQRSGSNIVASCKDCDFSEVLHTTANTVTVTENNLFDTDKFIRSYNAEGTNTTSHGFACFRRTDGKAVVVGNGDNYTSHDRDNDYLIPVEGGKTYQFDFDASTTYGDVMLFFRGAGNGYDSNYLSMRKSGTDIGTNTIEFTVPEGGKNLYIRVGTNSGVRNAYCVFSNFALHEKNDPNYRMITDVPSGSAINDYFTGFGTKDICHYEYKNSSISYTDGTVATGTTFNRNVNVVKSANHDIYKEFSNGTVAHFYCVTCGYNYDKETSLNMVYRESFDDASVSGSTFTSSNGNGTLANSGTGSIVEYAGGQDKGALYSNVRHNVLKLNANSTKPGNWMKLNTNPLTDPATAEKAKQEGITISFWRHMEKNGATSNLASSGDPTGYNWRNALSFHQDGNSGNRYYIEVNGVQSRCAVEGQDYTDLVPYYNDNTTKGTPNYTGDWVNIVVTIDPTDKVNGGTLYINGVPREYDLTRTKGAGKYVLSDTMNPGDIAADVINFLTQSDTGFYFNNGNPWEGNDYDMFYDDVRIYTGVMTQLQINEMYGAPDSDTPSTNSITHDPTNVTVYTLKAGTYTAANGSGDTYVAEAGKTVGEEFINYYGVDIATQVSNIEYYSFGTGMVIEKSSNGVDWTMVGDSKGHFAYQNEDLFGGKYTDVLSEPLNYAKQGASGGGYLLWAPHVMYNLELNKWVIYESTSSWGSQFSTIFYCTSDTVYKDYAYQGMIMKTNSSSKCNAIDSDVYYGRDENGIVDKSTLYLAYGSYSWNGSNIAIWGRELTATGENKSGVDSTWSESVDYPCIKADGSSSEGIFVYYYDGYYYMFTTYGGNDNNYTEVYFRSENPNGPFIRADGVNATAGTGMFFQSSYKNPVETYTYWSNGHNSVYTVYNNNNEPVLVNAAHSRVLSDGTVQSEEGQIITNQTDIRGNLMISNMIATTKSGWMVMFPLQYNGTDTTKLHLTASDVVGTYDAINNTKSTSNGVAQATTMTITACDDTHLWINGTLFALEYDADKNVTYIVGDTIEGAFAKQGDTVEFSFFNKNTLQHTWGYQTAKGDAESVKHNFAGESRHIDAVDDENGYTEYLCTVCNDVYGNKEYDGNDWAAYDSAVVVANANKAETKKYTAKSITEYSEEVAKYTDDVTSGDKSKSQAFIDRMTGGIQSATQLLKLAGYDVNFKVEYNNEVLESSTYGNVPFGTVKQFTYTAGEGKYIVKWTAEDEKDDQKRTSTIATASDTASHAIYSDTTITVYLSDTEVEVADNYSVTLIDKNEKVIGIANVPTTDNVVINTNGNELLFNENVAMSVPKYPYYQVTGFINADTNKSVVGETVNSNIRIKAVYSVISEIKINSSQNVTINKTNSAPYTAYFDEKIVAYAEGATAWYANGNLVAYGDTYTFQASATVELSYSTESVTIDSASSRIDYAQFDSGINAFRMVVSNCVPENAVIVEQGVKILTSSSTTATVTSDKVINGTKKYVATKTTGTGKQFMYTIAVNNNINTMAIVSFVTYTVDGGEPITVWSSEGATTATMVRR